MYLIVLSKKSNKHYYEEIKMKFILPTNCTIKEQDEYCRLHNRAILIRKGKKAGYFSKRVTQYACLKTYSDKYWRKGIWEDV